MSFRDAFRLDAMEMAIEALKLQIGLLAERAENLENALAHTIALAECVAELEKEVARKANKVGRPPMDKAA